MTKLKRPPRPVYSTRDRRDAARVLRLTRDLLTTQEDPFPVLEAARQVGVSISSPAWQLVAQARETAGGPRDESQLETAAKLIEDAPGTLVACTLELARVPRCRLSITGERCTRPLGHKQDCSPVPSPDDQVRGVGTDHVFIGGSPSPTKMLVAWETSAAGGNLRVRRDDHDRGLWVDHPQTGRSGKLLLGWPEIRRLVRDLNLELADRRGPPSAGSRLPKKKPVP